WKLSERRIQQQGGPAADARSAGNPGGASEQAPEGIHALSRIIANPHGIHPSQGVAKGDLASAHSCPETRVPPRHGFCERRGPEEPIPMKTNPLSMLALGSLVLVACASTPGTHPSDLSLAQHEQAAGAAEAQLYASHLHGKPPPSVFAHLADARLPARRQHVSQRRPRPLSRYAERGLVLDARRDLRWTALDTDL